MPLKVSNSPDNFNKTFLKARVKEEELLVVANVLALESLCSCSHLHRSSHDVPVNLEQGNKAIPCSTAFFFFFFNLCMNGNVSYP